MSPSAFGPVPIMGQLREALMAPAMQTVLLLIAVTGLTVAGDYCIKLASAHTGGLTRPIFIVGAIFYGLPAVGWFFLMRTHSLAAVGAFYAAANVIIMAALGTVVFKETFGVREFIGVSLAVASVVVMTEQS